MRIPAENDVYVRTAHAAACPLGPVEAQVCARADGEATVGDIAVLLNLSVRETAMVFARLLELGAVENAADLDDAWSDDKSEAVTVPPPRDES